MASNLVYMLLITLIIINIHFCNGWQQHSSMIVQGNVICNTCSNPGPSDSSYFIPGASVAVECSLNRKAATSVRLEGETDEMGEFKIEIPSLFHSKPERCSAQLLGSPHASCNVPALATSANFILKTDLDGVRTYSAGSLSFRPDVVPSACYTKDSDTDIFFVHGREALEKDGISMDKAQGSPPQASPTPPPGLCFPSNFPPLPPLSLPVPIPGIPHLPRFCFPPLPKLGFPPLPQTNVTIPRPPPISLNIPPPPPFALLTPPPPSE